jgi:protein SDA1
LKTLFPLLGMTASPNLRSYIFKCIMSDVKEANRKSKNHKLNRTIQGFLFSMVERDQGGSVEGTGLKKSKVGPGKATNSDREAMLAVRLCSELFRKGIWTDAKTVQIVSLACFHPNTKISSAALHFFLATEEDAMVDSDEEDADLPDIKKMYHQSTINKTRRSTKKKEKAIVKGSNKKRKRQEAKAAQHANFSALHLLLDPQDFAEKLHALLLKNDKAFNLEHKVLIMQLFGRVVGLHNLTVLGFYPYVTRYIAHHQKSVTAILVALASSVHDLTPPDVLTPVVRKLADQFVHPGVSAEVIAAGINAIREICRRQPLAMERDLLEDLTEYKKSRDKGVMYASRSLLQLYRDIDPGLLKRRERVRSCIWR